METAQARVELVGLGETGDALSYESAADISIKETPPRGGWDSPFLFDLYFCLVMGRAFLPLMERGRRSRRRSLNPPPPTPIGRGYLTGAARTQEVTKPITKQLTDTRICRAARHRLCYTPRPPPRVP